jgi:hypothetical protein
VPGELGHGDRIFTVMAMFGEDGSRRYAARHGRGEHAGSLVRNASVSEEDNTRHHEPRHVGGMLSAPLMVLQIRFASCRSASGRSSAKSSPSTCSFDHELADTAGSQVVEHCREVQAGAQADHVGKVAQALTELRDCSVGAVMPILQVRSRSPLPVTVIFNGYPGRPRASRSARR